MDQETEESSNPDQQQRGLKRQRGGAKAAVTRLMTQITTAMNCNQPKEVEMKPSQVTYVTMVPRVGNETLRPLGVATGNALSVTRSEDTYEKTPPVGRRQPMTSLPAYHNISAAGRIHHQLLRLKLASEAWLKAQGTQCLVPHSGNHGYIRNLRRSPSWELELRPLGVATGNVIPTSPC